MLGSGKVTPELNQPSWSEDSELSWPAFCPPLGRREMGTKLNATHRALHAVGDGDGVLGTADAAGGDGVVAVLGGLEVVEVVRG